MILTLEIPVTALENIPLGYKNRLEERTLLQIYKDGYISQKEVTQICRKGFDKLVSQFSIGLTKNRVSPELLQQRKKYFSEIGKGTEDGEWDDILQNIVSARVDKEEPPVFD